MFARGKILIVDGNFQVRRILCEILTRDGFEAQGFAALDKCIEILELENNADLLILDCPVPEMSAADAVGTIRSNGHAKPVLLISGTDQPQLVSTADGVHFLPKPFSGSELLAIVEALLSESF